MLEDFAILAAFWKFLIFEFKERSRKQISFCDIEHHDLFHTDSFSAVLLDHYIIPIK